MDTNEWTTEELRLREKFLEFDEEDRQQPMHPLDTSFMGTAVEKAGKKPRWRSYAARAAAIVLLVVTTSVITGIFVSEDYASAVRRSISQKLFEWQNDVAIVPEGEAAQEGDTVWDISDMEVVSKAKGLVPQLRIPSYVPSGYEFDNLRLSQYGNGDFFGEYQYKKGKTKIAIDCETISDKDSLYLMDNAGSLELGDRTVYFWEDPITESRGANVVLEGVVVGISGDIDELNKDILIEIAKGV